jgi:hypothetical protein
MGKTISLFILIAAQQLLLRVKTMNFVGSKRMLVRKNLKHYMSELLAFNEVREEILEEHGVYDEKNKKYHIPKNSTEKGYVVKFFDEIMTNYRLPVASNPIPLEDFISTTEELSDNDIDNLIILGFIEEESDDVIQKDEQKTSELKNQYRKSFKESEKNQKG